MTEPLTFSVFGTPRPKSRPRFIRGRVVTTANRHEKLWRAAVEKAARTALLWRDDPLPLFAGPVRLRMIFTFESPVDRRGEPHTQRPDADNLSKLVMDAMVKARVLADDELVAALPVEKWWGERAGVVVIAEPMDGSPAQAPSAVEPERPSWLAPSQEQRD